MSRIDSILSGSLVFRDNGTYLSEIRPGANKITITGSLHITGSNLLLNGSDIGLRITTLEAGQGADQIKFGAITLWTASMGEWSASIDNYVDNLNRVSSSFNDYTGSTNTRLSLLETSASYLDISSSLVDNRVTYIESKPLVSSSAQIYGLGFLSASITGIVSRSAQISDLGFITGSKFSELEDLPVGIVSGTIQIQDYLLNEDLDLGSGLLSAQNISVSGSINLDGQDISIELEKLRVFGLSGSYGSANTDIQVTGSFNLSLDGVTKYFSIDINGQEKVKVNEEGVFQLISQSSAPTAVEGGIYFGNDFNLYLGVND